MINYESAAAFLRVALNNDPEKQNKASSVGVHIFYVAIKSCSSQITLWGQQRQKQQTYRPGKGYTTEGIYIIKH